MAIEGSLRDMSLVDIIQLNCRSGEETRLSLSSGSRTGALYFAGGQIVHIESDDEQGEEALYRLLKWRDGRFVIERGIASPRQTIEVPWTALLMRSMKRLDEEQDAAGEIDEHTLREILQELADRVDGFVAARIADGKGQGLIHLVTEEDLDVERTMASLAHIVQQVEDALAVMDAGDLQESITLTARYRFITRPIGNSPYYAQVILGSGGNIGAARMYLVAYLATREDLVSPEGRQGEVSV